MIVCGAQAVSRCNSRHLRKSATTEAGAVGKVRDTKRLLGRLWAEEAAQDLTEYGLLLVLIALVGIATMKRLGGAANLVFSNAAASLSTS